MTVISFTCLLVCEFIFVCSSSRHYLVLTRDKTLRMVVYNELGMKRCVNVH